LLRALSINDTAGTLQFKSGAYSVSETGPTMTVTVTRTGGAASGVTVDYATSDGSATDGSDYTATSGTLGFGASEMSKTFTITLLDDGTDEPSESVNLTLSDPTGALSWAHRQRRFYSSWTTESYLSGDLVSFHHSHVFDHQPHHALALAIGCPSEPGLSAGERPQKKSSTRQDAGREF